MSPSPYNKPETVDSYFYFTGVHGELDQTAMSDARFVPPPGELDETYRLLVNYVKTKQEVHNILMSKEDQATATGNIYKVTFTV